MRLKPASEDCLKDGRLQALTNNLCQSGGIKVSRNGKKKLAFAGKLLEAHVQTLPIVKLFKKQQNKRLNPRNFLIPSKTQPTKIKKSTLWRPILHGLQSCKTECVK